MNFIFFVPDELRAESIGCYGHPVVQTPNMDRFAAEGVRFDQAFCQHTVCSPSRCSFMTGWYPHVNGHRTLWNLLKPSEPNLLKYLKQNGYNVLWNGWHNDLLTQESFEGSVSEWLSTGSGHHGPNAFKEGEPGCYSDLHEAYTGTVEEHGDMARVQWAIDFLKSKPQEPFVIYLPLYFPHCPYSAPEGWHDKYDPDSLPPLRPRRSGEGDPFHARVREGYHFDERVDDSLFRKIQSVYLGMVDFTDFMFGKLLDALDETGYCDSTTVCCWADHGDYAGDYGMVEKWPSGLEDCLTRVPLMMRMPGNKAGHVVKEQVELFDLMATVLDIADIEAEHTHFARSLVPQLNGAAGDPERIVFAEGGYDTHEPHCFEGYEPRMRKNPKNAGKYRPKYFVQQNHPLSVTRAVMARTPEYKLIYRPQSVSELFDLKKDPRELRNVIDDPAYGAIRADLQQKILDWLIHTSDVTPVHEDRRGLPPPSGPRVVSRDEAFDASGRIPGVGAARDQKASS